MAFIILDLLMILNIWMAFKYSKYLFSPPILLSIGLFVACFVCTIYFRDWEMEKFSMVTTLCIGGGTLIFTLTCILLQTNKGGSSVQKTTQTLNRKRATYFLIFCLVLAVWLFYQKRNFYMSRIGGASLSEVLYAVRLADVDDKFLQLPQTIKRIDLIRELTSIFAYVIIAYSVIRKWGKKYYILGGAYLFFMVYNGMLTGAKGNMFMPLIRFGLLFLYIFYQTKGRIKLNTKLIIQGSVLVMVLLGSLKGVSDLLGRHTDDRSSSDLIAEYIGAEIKNMDLFVQGLSPNTPSHNFLGYTLSGIYQELEINNPASYNYNFVGTHSLGNVYTLFYPYYQDFGVVGCLILPVIMAIVCMVFYNWAVVSLRKKSLFPLGMMYYSVLSYGITMAFFDAYLLKSVFCIYFLKIWILTFGVFYLIASKFLSCPKKIPLEDSSHMKS